MSKLSDLGTIAGADLADDDLFYVVDVSAAAGSKSKGITKEELLALLGDANEGPQGPAGADGNTWLSGSGVPTGGNDGDLYLRTSNSDVYLKTSGTWNVITNIKGSTGSTGPAGPPSPWKGEWTSEFQYVTGDYISYEGGLWIAHGDPSTGSPPGVDSYWKKITELNAIQDNGDTVSINAETYCNVNLTVSGSLTVASNVVPPLNYTGSYIVVPSGVGFTQENFTISGDGSGIFTSVKTPSINDGSSNSALSPDNRQLLAEDGSTVIASWASSIFSAPNFAAPNQPYPTQLGCVNFEIWDNMGTPTLTIRATNSSGSNSYVDIVMTPGA